MNKRSRFYFWRRYQFPLAAGLSILLIFVFISLSLRWPRLVRPLESLLIEVTAPVLAVGARLKDGCLRLWRGYFYLVGVQAENEALKQRLAQLEAQAHLYQEAKLEQERLRRLLELKVQLALPVQGARIIGYEITPWFKCALLDKGAREGLQRGMGVVNAEGVIGRLVECYPHYAKVLLLLDRSSAVDALVQRTRLRGILAGDGGRGCRLKYIHKDQDVQVGDLVLTSGVGGIFPAGLPLGKVTAVDRKSPGIFQEVEVTPAVDFMRLEEVLVIRTAQAILSN